MVAADLVRCWESSLTALCLGLLIHTMVKKIISYNILYRHQYHIQSSNSMTYIVYKWSILETETERERPPKREIPRTKYYKW